MAFFSWTSTIKYWLHYVYLLHILFVLTLKLCVKGLAVCKDPVARYTHDWLWSEFTSERCIPQHFPLNLALHTLYNIIYYNMYIFIYLYIILCICKVFTLIPFHLLYLAAVLSLPTHAGASFAAGEREYHLADQWRYGAAHPMQFSTDTVYTPPFIPCNIEV